MSRSGLKKNIPKYNDSLITNHGMSLEEAASLGKSADFEKYNSKLGSEFTAYRKRIELDEDGNIKGSEFKCIGKMRPRR